MTPFRQQMARAFARARHQRALLALLLLFPLALLGCQGGPTQGATKNVLNAVVALSPNDVWAVGGMSVSKSPGLHVLIEHWDGKQWHAAMPNVAGELYAISASSPTDIWAVGGSRYSPGGGQLLTLHWDGKQWQQFPASQPYSAEAPSYASGGVFNAVVSLSPQNAWAVGEDGRQPLIEHWDGKQWNSVFRRFADGSFALQAITAFSADDLWTVGFVIDSTGNRYSLTEHWDGHDWKDVSMPRNIPYAQLLGTPDFSGLATFPGGQVWAVGEIDLSSVYRARPLIERWDGTAWRVAYGSDLAQSKPDQSAVSLQAIAVVSAQDAWAVGRVIITDDPGNIGHVLVLHWNGQSWQQVKAPSFSMGSAFSAVAALSASDIWAVGDTALDYSGSSRTLIEHWNGSRWQAVPSPNPGTPGTAYRGG